ncbi:MAG: GGDEF domain-containing protein [Mycobacteriales bacterium]|nr:GGDEF domain-containing protein [Mycobacteriales bacterium]
MGHLDDALDDVLARWGDRFGSPVPEVARDLARELVLVELTGCEPSEALRLAAGALGVLRAHEGHDAAALVEDLYSVRPLVFGDHSGWPALELAVRTAVAAHSAERAGPVPRTRDPLTGLLDRAVFEEALAHEVVAAARHGAPALVVVDLDGLLGFAETHGHLAGDLHLVRVAELLTASSRRSDVLARLGADQLAVLLPRTDLARGLVVARRVMARAQSDARAAGATALPRLSIGVGWIAAPRTSGELLAAAEDALRRARGQGGWVVEAA